MKVNVGVEIGAKLIQAGIVDKYGRLLARTKVPSNYERPLKEIVSDAADLVNKLLDDKDFDLKDFAHQFSDVDGTYLDGSAKTFSL